MFKSPKRSDGFLGGYPPSGPRTDLLSSILIVCSNRLTYRVIGQTSKPNSSGWHSSIAFLGEGRGEMGQMFLVATEGF